MTAASVGIPSYAQSSSSDHPKLPEGFNRYPQIDHRFNPLRHRDGPNVAAFADEINDGPVLFALLQMHEVQISQFAPSESTAKQDSENCTVPFPLQSVRRRRLPEPTGASSAVSQFPSLTPSFLAPFTRRIPAASSGLSRPASAAS